MTAFRAGLGRFGRGLRARGPRWLARIGVALAGLALGFALAGRVSHDVGPFRAEVSLAPSLHGGATVRVPPLGALNLRAYRGPIGLRVELTQLREAEAQRLLRDPAQLAEVGDRAADDVQSAVVWLAVQATLAGLVGAALLSFLVFRVPREPAFSVGIALVLVVAVAGVGALTWSPHKLTEPRYTGLLANAPVLVGDARSLVSRFDIYRKELGSLITNTSKLYGAVSTLPAYQPDKSTIRVLHVSDLHLNPSAFNVISSVEKQFKPDLVVDTGDLTDFGTEPETRYVQQISRLRIPYLFVRGNHDSARTAAAVAREPNAVVLHGIRPVHVDGLSIVGTSDPRFTPDKDTRDDTASTQKVRSAGRQLASLVGRMKDPPDITMLHDPASAPPLAGKVPLVLAGHLHKRESLHLGTTLVLVEGSTGGAGLRGLQKEKPTPLECSMLYFDAGTHQLEAYDDITLGGLGESQVMIQRHVLTHPR